MSDQAQDTRSAANERLRLYGAWVIGCVCGVVLALTVLGLTGAIK